MIVIPAIDLMGGQVVRLSRGDPKSKKVYSSDPLEIARNFKDEGASLLHVVDLDAALGQGNNLATVERIIKDTNVGVQTGGGIRTLEYAQKLIDSGAKRIVVSTKAFQDRAFFKELLSRFAERVALGLDMKGGRPAIGGWQQTIAVSVENVIKVLEDTGLKWLIYTDISRDGTLKGVDFEGIREIKSLTKMQLIVSGGVGSLGDVKRLAELDAEGVIIGKAIYESRFSLKQAFEALQG